MINLGWLEDGKGLTGHSQASPGWVPDTGSSLDEMQDHVDAFRSNIGTLQRKVVELGGFYWQMIRGTGPMVSTVPPPGNITKNCHEPRPRKLTPAQCTTTLREWCPSLNSTSSDATEPLAPDTPATRLAHLYFVCPLMMQDPALALDFTAEFLLSRGPFAWIGYGWVRETQMGWYVQLRFWAIADHARNSGIVITAASRRARAARQGRIRASLSAVTPRPRSRGCNTARGRLTCTNGQCSLKHKKGYVCICIALMPCKIL